MVIVLMGVAGSGKTTLGQMLAAQLGWEFADADEFHPPANIAKMSAGHALDDRDRAPWLAAIRAWIDRHLADGTSGIVTCSALKERYRKLLGVARPDVRLVYLHGSRALLAERLAHRSGHFMKAGMLEGQLAALEEPVDALAVDVSPAPEAIVAAIRSALSL
jgi:carbohydrate kinase (thermoresistant glucokinase family)